MKACGTRRCCSSVQSLSKPVQETARCCRSPIKAAWKRCPSASKEEPNTVQALSKPPTFLSKRRHNNAKTSTFSVQDSVPSTPIIILKGDEVWGVGGTAACRSYVLEFYRGRCRLLHNVVRVTADAHKAPLQGNIARIHPKQIESEFRFCLNQTKANYCFRFDGVRAPLQCVRSLRPDAVQALSKLRGSAVQARPRRSQTLSKPCPSPHFSVQAPP